MILQAPCGMSSKCFFTHANPQGVRGFAAHKDSLSLLTNVEIGVGRAGRTTHAIDALLAVGSSATGKATSCGAGSALEAADLLTVVRTCTWSYQKSAQTLCGQRQPPCRTQLVSSICIHSICTLSVHPCPHKVVAHVPPGKLDFHMTCACAY